MHCVRQRTDGGGRAGEDGAAIWRSHEDSTVTHLPVGDEDRLMAELSIIRGGRHYFYDGYQYDRLADAITYAQLVRGQAGRPGPSSPTPVESVGLPTACDRQ
jgi:hypothetical protein